jgi:uncharacterized sporulation protein YeaH/YhbH (DUF444 family)
VVEEFIIHDETPEIVSEHGFYNNKKNGGTKFKPTLKLVRDMVLGADGQPAKYPPDQWNVYIFHSTDGDTAGDEDGSAEIIEELVDNGLNLYGLIQVEGTKNKFHEALDKRFGKGSAKSRFIRKAHMTNDSPEECKKAVHAMLGKDEVRPKE